MVTQAELKRLLNYNIETGNFTWKSTRRGQVMVGDIAGCGDASYGYTVIKINGRLYRAHRLAWLYVHGKFPKNQIDHINHIRSDNRLSNLRHVTQVENHQNCTMDMRNTSGRTGVYWEKARNKWRARIKVGGKRLSLGSYIKHSDACEARDAADIEYGFHENHGARL